MRFEAIKVRVLLLFSATAVLVGCPKSNEPSVQNAPGDVAVASAPAPVPEAPDAGAAPVDAAAMACVPGKGGVGCRICGREGALLEIVPADTVHPPDDANVLAQSKPPGKPDPRALQYTIAATPELLIAQVFTCPGCRRMMGWGASIRFDRLRELSDLDALALQRALGFAAERRLDTFEAWRTSKPISAPVSVPQIPSCGEK